MVVETGKEPKELIKKEAREGKAFECSECEYLVFLVNQQGGNCILQIEKKAKKIKGEIAAVKS